MERKHRLNRAMSTLSRSLLAKDIHLSLRSANPADALEEVLCTLRGDERVTDWELLRGSLVNGSPIDCGPDGSGMIILHHRRTPSVTGMVLAAGRYPSGLAVSDSTTPLRMLLVAAIPESLDNEYLRVIGAVSRICVDPASFDRLMDARDEASFLAILEEGIRR